MNIIICMPATYWKIDETTCILTIFCTPVLYVAVGNRALSNLK